MPRPEISSLQFLGYDVPEISFVRKAVDENPDAEDTVKYTPRFNRDIVSADNGIHKLRLSVTVGTQEDHLPFTATVKVEGHFRVDGTGDPVKYLEINATAILFPYLRAVMSSLTMLANIPPLILPTFNIVELFKDKEESAQELGKKRSKPAGRPARKNPAEADKT